VKLTAIVVAAILFAGCDLPTITGGGSYQHCTSIEDCDTELRLRRAAGEPGGMSEWRCISNSCVNVSDIPDTY